MKNLLFKIHHTITFVIYLKKLNYEKFKIDTILGLVLLVAKIVFPSLPAYKSYWTPGKDKERQWNIISAHRGLKTLREECQRERKEGESQ